jgi:predicted metal-dependent phosphoesterase TrpH
VKDAEAVADLRSSHDLYDLHFHTRHSDGLARTRDVVALARERGVKVAITDHNVIGGALEADEGEIVPGVEVTTSERIHLLIYFRRTADLRHFWDRRIAPYRPAGASALTPVRRSAAELIEDLQPYDHLTSAAHPFAIAKNGWMSARARHGHLIDSLGDVDAVEALNGEELDAGNERTAALARERSLAVTVGSDGHLLRELGHVALAVPRGEDLFEVVRAREGAVVDLRLPGTWRRLASHAAKAPYFAGVPVRALRKLLP